MADSKSTKLDSNLLHYLVSTIERQREFIARDLLEFFEDLPHVEAASRIALSSVLGELNNLQKDFDEIDAAVKEIEKTTKSDKFQKKMTVILFCLPLTLQTFVKDAKEDLASMNKKRDEALESFKQVVAFFGEDEKSTPEQFFGIIHAFITQFTVCYFFLTF